jgi:ubiquitin-conjugating enzyme E2 variant
MDLATKPQVPTASLTAQIRDWLGVVLFGTCMLALFVRIGPYVMERWALAGTAILLAYLLADFVSGVFHWMGDTWGSTDMPILGQAFIKPFREHHVDQLEITRHDFLEVNGNNCIISLPFALGAHFIPFHHGETWSIFAVSFVASFVMWIFATNQFHKWSHMDDAPGVVAWLQRVHLILPPVHHSVHHTAPYSKYYCITVGWLNQPLSAIDFFGRLERVITRLTGAVPRAEEKQLMATERPGAAVSTSALTTE